ATIMALLSCRTPTGFLLTFHRQFCCKISDGERCSEPIEHESIFQGAGRGTQWLRIEGEQDGRTCTAEGNSEPHTCYHAVMQWRHVTSSVLLALSQHSHRRKVSSPHRSFKIWQQVRQRLAACGSYGDDHAVGM